VRRSLFEKFLTGVTSDTIKDALTQAPVRPCLVANYEAGETVLKLSNTATVKPGDVLELRVPVLAPSEQSPKFSLIEELRSTGSLSTTNTHGTLGVSSNASSNTEIDTRESSISSTLPPSNQQQLALPWQKEADAISQKLAEIKNYRSYQIQVEAVLNDKQVQVTPTWSDIPSGIEVTKRRTNLELPNTNFLHHVRLDWQVLVGEKLVSYSEYNGCAGVPT
jgi:hypothetical protein